MNSRGIAPSTLIELIIVLAAAIVIIILVVQTFALVSPTTGGFMCGLNVRIKAAMPPIMKEFTPIMFCGQYEQPVRINAADFRACPGLADFCSKPPDDSVRQECVKQCARIQIDRLTQSCWSMAGEGRFDLIDPVFDGMRFALYDLGKLSPFKPENIAKVLSLPSSPIADVINSMSKEDRKSLILRCYRFQIVNPARLAGKDMDYEDYSLGLSWVYKLNETLCKNYKAPGNEFCSYGGDGFVIDRSLIEKIKNDSSVDEDEFDELIREEIKPLKRFYLNYEAKPRDICYVAYYQTISKSGDKRFIIRNCKSFTEYAGAFKHLN